MVTDYRHKLKNIILKAFSSLVPTAIPPSSSPPVIAKADSGASGHYFSSADAHILQNPTSSVPALRVRIPNGENLKSVSSGTLPLSYLGDAAKVVHTFPHLKTSLISVGQLCDDDCIVQFARDDVIVAKDDKIVLTGERNHTDGLWDIPLHSGFPSPLPSIGRHSQMNVILRNDKSKSELAQYFHAICMFPTLRLWRNKILQGNFISWPGLNPELLRHLPKSINTYLGHMRHEAKNLRSTKLVPPMDSSLAADLEEDPIPADFPYQRQHECYVTIMDMDPTSTAYLDLTGSFPYVSSRGNRYIFVLYDYDSNAILVQPIKSRAAAVIKQAWLTLHEQLKPVSNPSLYIMDNEASYDLKAAMGKHSIDYQLVPPHSHRRNAAERAIQTFKAHFISGLSGVHPDFPITEWDRLLEQAQLTLNLLRNSRVNPKLSSYAYLFGNFDFNKTPLAPVGTKVLVFEHPSTRGSWAYRGTPGWYIGPSMEHYRCVTCFIPSTNTIRHCDTVEFFPHATPIPELTTDSYLRQAASDIVHLLKNKPSIVPSLAGGTPTNIALEQIASLLNRSLTLPSPLPPLEQPALPNKHPHQSLDKTPSQTPPPSTPLPDTRSASPHSRDKPLGRCPRVVSPQIDPVPRVKEVSTDVSPFSPPKSLPASAPAHRRPLIFQRPYTRGLARSQQVNAPQAQYMEFSAIPRRYRTAAVNHIVRQRNIDYIEKLLQPTVCHIYNEQTGKRETLASVLQGPHKARWNQSLINELGRLAQGGNDPNLPSNDCIEFIPFHQVPKHKKVTYGQFVLDYRPLKADPWRIRIVVGGDKLEYEFDAGSPAANLLETKLILNSVISDHKKHNSRFMTCDIKDFFLASPMAEPEYMRLPVQYFPDFIKEKYNINAIVHTDGYVYVKIKKGMYGLKQAAILAYDQLVKNLANHGYHPCPNSVGIWKHETRATKFCLCVDDFGIKYNSVEDANHLLNALKQYYKLSVDWNGENYCGLTIKWNYKEGYVDISIPGYIHSLLQRLKHTLPRKVIHHPHDYTLPAYGTRRQYVQDPDTTPFLDKAGTKFVQSTVGALLYYSRATDSTMLPALNEIAATQARPTCNTLKATNHLLDFAASYPLAIIRFYASDMILAVESDAAYLVMPNAKSRVAGYYHMTNPDLKLLNGAILVECLALKHVVSSAAEAETGGLFHNAQQAVVIRQILHDLGHPQPPTPIKTDNSTARNFVHATLKQKRSKSWDMRYHWLRCRETQKQVKIYWEPGTENNADYFTKHHPPKHHCAMRPRYIVHDTGNPLQKPILRQPDHLNCEGVLAPKSPWSHKSNQTDLVSPVGDANANLVSAIRAKLNFVLSH